MSVYLQICTDFTSLEQTLGCDNLDNAMMEWLLDEFTPVMAIINELDDIGYQVILDPENRVLHDSGGDCIAQFKTFEELKEHLEAIYDEVRDERRMAWSD